jgi:hypothetical protein
MKKLITLLLITSSIYVTGQAYLGLHNSNYIGVMGFKTVKMIAQQLLVYQSLTVVQTETVIK